MYQNNHLFTKEYTWQKAKEYCSNLRLGGYSDWRLPNRKELNAIRTKDSSKSSKGYTQYIRKEFIENMPDYSWFWTSEERDSSSAWVVDVNYGNGFWSERSNTGYALCVR
jgi:hypothetical protein